MIGDVFMDYKSNNITHLCKYNIVWFSKYLRKILVGTVETHLKEIVNRVCSKFHVQIIEMEVMPDHIHLLLEVDSQLNIHKVIKMTKKYSSKILRAEFKTIKLPSFWANSYFISTVDAPLEIIK
jgi:putative transposase